MSYYYSNRPPTEAEINAVRERRQKEIEARKRLWEQQNREAKAMSEVIKAEQKEIEKAEKLLVEKLAKEHNIVVNEDDYRLVTEAIKTSRSGGIQNELKYEVSNDYAGPIQVYQDDNGVTKRTGMTPQIIDNPVTIFKILLNTKREQTKPKTLDELYNLVKVKEDKIKSLEEKIKSMDYC
jgi:hypothetical protein